MSERRRCHSFPTSLSLLDQLHLLSWTTFLSLLLALANQLDTCTMVMLEPAASSAFSALVGYGLCLWRSSHLFRGRTMSWMTALRWRGFSGRGYRVLIEQDILYNYMFFLQLTSLHTCAFLLAVCS